MEELTTRQIAEESKKSFEQLKENYKRYARYAGEYIDVVSAIETIATTPNLSILEQDMCIASIQKDFQKKAIAEGYKVSLDNLNRFILRRGGKIHMTLSLAYSTTHQAVSYSYAYKKIHKGSEEGGSGWFSNPEVYFKLVKEIYLFGAPTHPIQSKIL